MSEFVSEWVCEWVSLWVSEWLIEKQVHREAYLPKKSFVFICQARRVSFLLLASANQRNNWKAGVEKYGFIFDLHSKYLTAIWVKQNKLFVKKTFFPFSIYSKKVFNIFKPLLLWFLQSTTTWKRKEKRYLIQKSFL